MRAKIGWPRQRHSYAESSTGDYILDESDHDQSAPSSNLVSHFVSTRDISTYYDGTEYRTITADEILHSKREEIFNAYKRASVRRNTELMGGSVRHLPVSSKEFGFMNDIIQEELDSEPTGKSDCDKNKENQPNLVPAAKVMTSIHRQPSEASSSSSGGTHYSSVLHDSTWSIGWVYVCVGTFVTVAHSWFSLRVVTIGIIMSCLSPLPDGKVWLECWRPFLFSAGHL